MKAETYLRFVVPELHTRSQLPKGLFSTVWAPEEARTLTPHERAWWSELVKWFGQNLPEPPSARRSARPNVPNRGVFWFKATAVGHISRMREVANLLEAHGIVVEVIQSSRPGYVVYEDEYQVAAEPFRSELS